MIREVAEFCTNCGKKSNGKELFCTGCGMEFEANQPLPIHEATPSTDERVSRTGQKASSKGLLITIFAIAGIIVIAVASYFIIGSLKDNKEKVAPRESTKQQQEESVSPPADQKTENSGSTHSDTAGVTKSEDNSSSVTTQNREQSTLQYYTNQLNNLKIVSSGKEISVGRWELSHQNNTVSLFATSIPPKELAAIFSLYDAGDLAPLQTWAQAVYEIAENVATELHAAWNIGVGNSCVAEYPVTLPSDTLISYSGSCGYSIPVLTGTNKENLSLVIDYRVFGFTKSSTSTIDPSTDFIFPYSEFTRLTERELEPLTLQQLRIARNEIYARHGFIFQSEDLRIYFSKKSWYFPDASFDGNHLNEIEKYNVLLIQNREKELTQ